MIQQEKTNKQTSEAINFEGHHKSFRDPNVKL